MFKSFAAACSLSSEAYLLMKMCWLFINQISDDAGDDKAGDQSSGYIDVQPQPAVFVMGQPVKIMAQYYPDNKSCDRGNKSAYQRYYVSHRFN
jgi:hypothetical protein